MQGKGDTRVAELASKQHGVVAAWQMVRMGSSRGWIEHQLRLGRLHRIFRGVYAVGHAAVTTEGRLMAAVLAYGGDAKLTHWSATTHWGLLQTNRAVIDVVVRGNRRAQKGIRIHRSNLAPDEWTRRDNIPITTIPRTLLDLASIASPRQLKRATNQAARLGWLNPEVITELQRRHRGRPGMKAFKAVTAAVNPQTRRTRSELEDDFLALCRCHPQWPRAISNPKVEGFLVDIHFVGTKLIVELDHYDYHRTPYEFDSDRRRDGYLKTKGFEVLRVSDEWFNSDPGGVAATVAQLLAAIR